MERRSRTWSGGVGSGGEEKTLEEKQGMGVFSASLVDPSSHEVNVSGGLASAGIFTPGSVCEGVERV